MSHLRCFPVLCALDSFSPNILDPVRHVFTYSTSPNIQPPTPNLLRNLSTIQPIYNKTLLKNLSATKILPKQEPNLSPLAPPTVCLLHLLPTYNSHPNQKDPNNNSF